MSGDLTGVQLCEDFSRESLQLNQHLEKMTEQMEDVSGNLGSIKDDDDNTEINTVKEYMYCQ